MKKKMLAASMMLVGAMSTINAEGLAYNSLTEFKSMPDVEGIAMLDDDTSDDDKDGATLHRSSPMWDMRVL